MPDSNVSVPSGDPPKSLNALMRLLLKTPLLQNSLGKHLALLSFTGRRTGKQYTIPISYERNGNSVLMLTRTSRSWWRNFEDVPAVELRLAGEVAKGTAEAHVGTEHDLDEVVEYLTTRPRDAEAYGIAFRSDGSLDPEDVEALLPMTVLVHVDLD